MLVSQLEKLSDKLFIPIYLYDTNLKDELYYQDLGFFDTTKKGNHGEPLLVYKPKNLETNKKKSLLNLYSRKYSISISLQY